MKVCELAKKCGYEFVGKNIDVDSIRYAAAADVNSIAIAKSVKEIDCTKANCVLISLAFVDTDKTLIYSSDPLELASVKIAKVLAEANGQTIYKKTTYKKQLDYFVGKNILIGRKTIISPNVYIEDDVQIGGECYVEPNVHIGRGTIIGSRVYIGSGSSVGANSFYHYYEDNQLVEFPGLGKTIIYDGVSIGNNTTIQRGTFSDTIIQKECKIGNLIDIGHDVEIGINCKIVSQTGIASDVHIGNYVQIFGQVGVANNISIGDYAVVLAKSLVAKNILLGQKVSGMYAREHSEELKIQAKLRRLYQEE